MPLGRFLRWPVLAPAAMLALGGGVLISLDREPGPPPPLLVMNDSGQGAIGGETGVVGIGEILSLTATAPVTLVGVRPDHLDPAVELIAARAYFWGRGTTGAGYRMYPGYPGVTCGTWPVTGYGPSFPVENLRLAADDSVFLVYYIRSSEPGRRTASGYRLTYRTANGKTGTLNGEGRTLRMELHEPGRPPAPGISPCKPTDGWTRPEPGYPA